jgi:CubicO group peptidase (beta-lactamase class C family)
MSNQKTLAPVLLAHQAQTAALELIDAGHVPGLVLAVARGSGPVETLVLGADAAGRALEADTLFPVASITKLATALAVLRLIDSNRLGLDDELAHVVPGAAAAQPGVTIRTLLCHTSGLPLDVPTSAAPYAEGLDWGKLREACLHTALDEPPWNRVQYSNVGYGLLALVVEEVTGQEFAAALRQLVLEPLGVEAYLGAEPPRSPALLADARGAHAGTPLEPFNSRFYRSLALPWAGLVTTAAGALALVRAFAGYPGDFLTPALRDEAISDQTRGLGGGFIPPLRWSPCPWGLGPEVRGAKQPHWVPAATPASFGHSGQSGALAWFEPATGVAWALLGTRTADGGWLLRRSGTVSAALLAAGAGR